MWLNNLLKQYEVWARQWDVPVSTAATRSVLQRLITYMKPNHCVEIWTAVWLWTAMLADQVRLWWGSVTSFEISYPSYHKARLFIQSCHLFNTTLYHCDFQTCPLEKVLPAQIDCVFVDGMKSLYQQYFDRCVPFCHNDTFFVFDDVEHYEDKVGNLAQHCIDQGRLTHCVPTEPWDSVLIVYKETSPLHFQLQDGLLSQKQ